VIWLSNVVNISTTFLFNFLTFFIVGVNFFFTPMRFIMPTLLIYFVFD